jgi:hypothetical protein
MLRSFCCMESYDYDPSIVDQALTTDAGLSEEAIEKICALAARFGCKLIVVDSFACGKDPKLVKDENNNQQVSVRQLKDPTRPCKVL